MTLDPDEVEIDLSEVDWDNYDAEDLEVIEELVAAEKPIPKLDPAVARYISKQRLFTVDALYAQPPIDWFIEGLLPEVPRTIIQGAGGSFKSFLVLDWMLCAATRHAWFDRSVKPGRVLYMAGEGARGLPRRITAWCDRNRVTRKDLGNIAFLAQPFELFSMSNEARDKWRAYLAYLKLDYIVIDTLHTASSGAEENSNTNMGTVIDNATYIAGGPHGAKLIVIHHRSKAMPGARGASMLRDDFDASCNVDLPEHTELTAKLSADKIRDAEAFKPLTIKFAKHLSSDGPSLYIEEVIDTGVKDPEKQSTTRTTQQDRCEAAILRHDLLDTGWGERRISEELKALDLGYDFGHGTVGRALLKLRTTAIEVQNMLRNQERDDATGDD